MYFVTGNLCPFVFLTYFSPVSLLLWQPPVCSLSVIPFLFGYTCSFVSVFRFHLYVKSYSICLSFYLFIFDCVAIISYLSFSLFVCLFLAVLGLCCSEQGILFVVEHRLGGHRLQQLGLSASGVQAQWLWHWAELARSMWDLPGLGSDLCPCFCRWILNHREDQYLSFFVWLILLSIIPSRFFHVLANGKISFFLGMSSIPLYRYTTSLSIHPSVGTWVPTT